MNCPLTEKQKHFIQLYRKRWNTTEIAALILAPESAVYNHIARLTHSRQAA
jgi:predicted DNA-binding protein YlxM (UPF0122 family)